jgi:transposase InsO family protein
VTEGCRWGVEPICKELQVAPSTYYDQKFRPPSMRELRDRELGPQLAELWKKNYSVYGRRKLTTAAKRHGIDVGRDQVARLMRREGIRGASRAKKRFTTHADMTHTRAPDLVQRDFTATRPDGLWVATSPTARHGPVSSTWRSSLTCSADGSSAGRQHDR